MVKEKQEYIVDSLSICKERDGTAQLSILLTLLLELRKKGHSFLCVFDQSAYGEFKNQGARILDVYVSLKKYSTYFCQIRGKADPKVLEYANEQNKSIISNDTYHEFITRYPWLRKQRDRLITVSVLRDKIICEPLNISIREITDVERVWRELEILLKDSSFPLSGRNAPVRAEQPKRTVPLTGPSGPGNPKAGTRVPQAQSGTVKKETRTTPKRSPSREGRMSSSPSNPIEELVEAGLISEEVADILQFGQKSYREATIESESTEIEAIVVAIDRSGSMRNLKNAVIEGQKHMFNALLGASRKFDLYLAQILFNHEIDNFQDFCEFRKKDNPNQIGPGVKFLDDASYDTVGYTALYDAILRAICLLVPVIYKTYQDNVVLGTRVCILTDGVDEGPGGRGTGSKITPDQLRKVIDYLVNGDIINRIILAGAGNYDYKAVGRELGIVEVIEIEKDEKGIRRAFELFSSMPK